MHINCSNFISLRRDFRIGGSLATVFLTLLSASVFAQPYPTKSVRFIVPNVPGGSGDVIARVLTEKLQQRMGQPFIIDNRPGAGTIIGTMIAARAAPDGYTLILSALPHVINPHLQKSVGYHPVNDFSAITLIGVTPMYLFSSLDSNVKSVKELISQAKSSPGKLTAGSGGVGTATHLAIEMLNVLGGVSLVHAPYKGTGPALTDLAGGHIPLAFASMAAAAPFIKNGKITTIAVANDRRSQAFSTIPTFEESGLKGLTVVHWIGVLGPAKMDAQVLARLNSELVRIVADPNVRERFERLDIEAITNTPDEFRRFLANEDSRWGEVLKKSNLSTQ